MALIRLCSRILFWTYPRGGWQYDIVSALILAFIFLTPPSFFDGSIFEREQIASDIVQSEQEREEDGPPVKP